MSNTNNIPACPRFTHVVIDLNGVVLAGPGTREWCFTVAEEWSDAADMRIVPISDVA